MVNQLVEKSQKPQQRDAENRTTFFKDLYQKIRAFKYIKVVTIAFVIGIALLIITAVVVPEAKNRNAATVSADPMRELEQKLEGILSEIKGAGKVSVMIMFDGGMETEVAYSTNTTTNKTTDNAGGSERVTENTTTTSTPIVITENGQTKPIVLKESLPPVKGVMIVAEGADNITVRMELLRAAARTLGIESSIIEIFAKQK